VEVVLYLSSIVGSWALGTSFLINLKVNELLPTTPLPITAIFTLIASFCYMYYFTNNILPFLKILP